MFVLIPIMGGGSVLAVVIDAHPYSWGARRADASDTSAPPSQRPLQLQFGDLVDDLAIFLNAFMLLDPKNEPIVIAAHPTHSTCLFPQPEPDPAILAAAVAARIAGSLLFRPATEIMGNEFIVRAPVEP